MPTVIPNTASEKISFFTAHVPVWAEDPAGIGTTAESVERVQEKLDLAREAFMARAQAAAAARSATQRLRDALAELDKVGAQVVAEVKVAARVSGNDIYAKALIDKPAEPSKLGKPGMVSQLKTDLLPNGSLRLTWKCRHPRGAKGTLYHVYRASGVNGEFAFLGASGKKKFLDATIPAGSPRFCYRIVAVRSTARGEAAEFLVNLGVSGKPPEMPHDLDRPNIPPVARAA